MDNVWLLKGSHSYIIYRIRAATFRATSLISNIIKYVLQAYNACILAKMPKTIIFDIIIFYHCNDNYYCIHSHKCDYDNIVHLIFFFNKLYC